MHDGAPEPFNQPPGTGPAAAGFEAAEHMLEGATEGISDKAQNLLPAHDQAEGSGFIMPEDDGDLDEWADQPRDYEAEQRSAKEDRMAQYYIQGVEINPDEPFDGISSEDMHSWLENLGEKGREDIEVHRALHSAEMKLEYITREFLSKEAPELLESKLPRDMEALVDGQYVLGSNQTLGVMSVEEASRHLAEVEGISLNGYDPNSRILFSNEFNDGQEVVRGYYGAELAGRFVTATPMAGEAAALLESNAVGNAVNTAYRENLLPADYTLNHGSVRGGVNKVVNPKYVAGFVDTDGHFHRNANFMRSNTADLGAETSTPEAKPPVEAETELYIDHTEPEPDMASEKDTNSEIFESQVQEFVRGIHARAEAENRELNPDEVQQIKSLAQVVQQRRAATEAPKSAEADSKEADKQSVAEVVQYMKDNDIDIDTAGKRYEAQVQQFVQGLREKAASEGRELNAQETQQIKNAVETVNDLRNFASKAA